MLFDKCPGSASTPVQSGLLPPVQLAWLAHARSICQTAYCPYRFILWAVIWVGPQWPEMDFTHNFKSVKFCRSEKGLGTPFWSSRVLGLWASIWTFPTPALYCPKPKMGFSILDLGLLGRTGHAWIWFRELGQILGTWHGIGTQACPLQSGFAVL